MLGSGNELGGLIPTSGKLEKLTYKLSSVLNIGEAWRSVTEFETRSERLEIGQRQNPIIQNQETNHMEN